MKNMTELTSLMSNPTRLEILLYLLERPEASVGEVVADLSVPQSTVSNQLKLLRLGNLVKSRREGVSVFYSLKDDHVSGILKILYEHVSEGEEKDA